MNDVSISSRDGYLTSQLLGGTTQSRISMISGLGSTTPGLAVINYTRSVHIHLYSPYIIVAGHNLCIHSRLTKARSLYTNCYFSLALFLESDLKLFPHFRLDLLLSSFEFHRQWDKQSVSQVPFITSWPLRWQKDGSASAYHLLKISHHSSSWIFMHMTVCMWTRFVERYLR